MFDDFQNIVFTEEFLLALTILYKDASIIEIRSVSENAFDSVSNESVRLTASHLLRRVDDCTFSAP